MPDPMTGLPLLINDIYDIFNFEPGLNSVEIDKAHRSGDTGY